MLRLTDSQLSALFTAAKPLPRDAREPFLLAVVELLRAHADPGDGDVHRCIRQAQKRFWDPPLDAPGRGHKGAHHPAIE